MTKIDRGEREKEEDGDNDGNLEFVCVIQWACMLFHKIRLGHNVHMHVEAINCVVSIKRSIQ